MTWYQLFSVLIVIVATFSYINFRYIKLPKTIGLMLISLVFSLLMLATAGIFPAFKETFLSGLGQFDFSSMLLNAMLSFLLFAGAIHIKLNDLYEQRLPVLLFSTFSVLISTILVGILTYYITPLFGIKVNMIQALMFGSLISPTDPIAVLSILRQAGISKSLETIISGESLFNDGVAVVIFMTLGHIGTTGEFVISDALLLFGQEALGGVLLGIILGYIGFLLLKSIDDYGVEVIITLAIVMGGNTLAELIHVSGPLAMVVAGLITGNQSKEQGMSDMTAEYVFKFWELMDDILNSVLFVLMGLEILLITISPKLFWMGLLLVFVLLTARYISLWIPARIIRRQEYIDNNTLNILTWGGLRGGISIALALSLTTEMGKDIWVPVTYVIVCFAILIQGTTVQLLPGGKVVIEDEESGPVSES